MTDDWPSHTQELTRKTTEQLQIWTDRYDKGIIGLSTMIAVIATIYDTTSGLIEREVSMLLADLHTDLVREAKTKV